MSAPLSPTLTSDALERRFIALCLRIGHAAAHLAPALYHTLEALYAHPPRAYHNLDHVAHLLDIFDAHRSHAQNADAVEFAIWLHDCVYVPGRPDNEERSADVAVAFAKALDCGASFTSTVQGMILATKHNGPAADSDARLVADIDISVLALPDEAYRENSRRIRTEFAFADDKTYSDGRRRFIADFLSRPAIFQTDPFRTAFESAARANLSAERDSLLP